MLQKKFILEKLNVFKFEEISIWWYEKRGRMNCITLIENLSFFEMKLINVTRRERRKLRDKKVIFILNKGFSYIFLKWEIIFIEYLGGIKA